MTIYYWKGVANFDPKQFSAAAKTIDYLLQGDYRETGLEQLKGKNIYSARINDANRLLFTSLKKRG